MSIFTIQLKKSDNGNKFHVIYVLCLDLNIFVIIIIDYFDIMSPLSNFCRRAKTVCVASSHIEHVFKLLGCKKKKKKMLTFTN